MTTVDTREKDDLFAAVERRLGERRATARTQAQAGEVALAASRQSEIGAFRSAVDAAFGPALQRQLQFGVPGWSARRGAPAVSMIVDGETWRLWRNGTRWAIDTDLSDRSPAFLSLAPELPIVDALVAFIVEHREQRARAQEQAANAEAAERALREAHAACEAIVDAAVADARAALWQWPDGAELVLYRVSWEFGGHPDGSAATTSGWTLDRIDSNGRVVIAPERADAYRNDTSPRLTDAEELFMIPLAHRPLFRRQVFRSVAELPRELRVTVQVAVPGITHAAAEDDYYAHGQPTDRVEVDVGDVPVAWICELLDRQRGGTS